MNSFKHSSPFSLEESSPLTMLTGTSAITYLPYFLLLHGRDWHISLDLLKVIVFALCKWFLCVLMQFWISLYSLILFWVQLKYGNWEQCHSLHQNWYYIFLSMVLLVLLFPCWLWPHLLNLLVLWKTFCYWH